jgi:hypothetical protein
MYNSYVAIKINEEIFRNLLSTMIRGELTKPKYAQYSLIYKNLRINKPTEKIMTFSIFPNVFALLSLNTMLTEFGGINSDHCNIVELSPLTNVIDAVQLSQFPLPGWASSPIAGLDD